METKRKNKRGQVNFSWLFAIIVGGSILVLAIYGATKVIGTGGDVGSARAGKEIGILLNPLETGFEMGQVTYIQMPVETIIHNSCEAVTGNFGSQKISASQKSFGKWNPTDIDVRFQNKYIFSEESVQGKEFMIFSRPFEFPFKVADMIYMTPSGKDYCFDDAPEDIKKELEDLFDNENIFVKGCPSGSERVCFSSREESCDVIVNYNDKEVSKNGSAVYFEGDSLMYAAIFSSPKEYDCQVERLMKRVVELSSIYSEKSEIVSQAGCSQELNLFSLRSLAENVESSEDIFLAAREAASVERDNDRARCRLW